MKKQTTKRALAGVLAVLTVAGSAPANVGGLIFAANNAIVASAVEMPAQEMTFNSGDNSELYNFITSVKDGDNAAVTTLKAGKNKSFDFTTLNDVEIKSTVPLEFTATAVENDTSTGKTFLAGAMPAGYNVLVGEDAQDSTKKTFTYYDKTDFFAQYNGQIPTLQIGTSGLYGGIAVSADNKYDVNKYTVLTDGAADGLTFDGSAAATAKTYYKSSDGQAFVAVTSAQKGDTLFYTNANNDKLFEVTVIDPADYTVGTEGDNCFYKKVSQDEVITAAVKEYLSNGDAEIEKEITDDMLKDLENGSDFNKTTGAIIIKPFTLVGNKAQNGVYTYNFVQPNFPLTITGQAAALTITMGLGKNTGNETVAPNAWGPTDNLVKGTEKTAKTLGTVENGGLGTVNIFNVKKTNVATPSTGYTLGTPGTPITTNVLVNEDLKIQADGYFRVYIWDGNKQTNYTYQESNLNGQKYETTIKALDSATENHKTEILIVAADEAYSYTLSGDQTALNAKGAGIDKVAAKVTAEYFGKDADGKYVSKGEKLETNAAALDNKTLVKVNFNELTKFVEADKKASVKITRNGTELKDDYTFVDNKGQSGTIKYSDIKDEIFKGVDATNDGTEHDKSVYFNGAGQYEVTFSVWTHVNDGTTIGSKKQDMIFKFEISKLSELTANNVQLYLSDSYSATDASSSNGGVTVQTKKAGYELLNITTDPNVQVKDILKSAKPKLIDGVYTFELKQGKELGSKTVKIDADLFVDAAKKSGFENKNDNTKSTYYIVRGAQEVSAANKIQEIYVDYYDPEFSNKVQTITLKWQVAAAAQTVQIVSAEAEVEHLTLDIDDPDYNENFSFDEVDWDSNDVESEEWKPKDIQTSIDELDQLEEMVKDSIYVVNGDIDNVTFEYVEGKGARLANDELDIHYDGLPTEVGDYSVYILYKGEAKNIINISISEHSLYAAPTEEQLSFTYGTPLFNEETLAYNDTTGNAIEGVVVENPDITAQPLIKLTNKEIREVRDGKLANGYGADVYVIDKVQYRIATSAADAETLGLRDLDVAENKYLNAGNYLVTVKQGASTKIEQEGYSLSKQQFIVKVAKKKITEDMILIDPLEYTGKNVTITSNEINGKDIDLENQYLTLVNEYDTYDLLKKVDLKLQSGTSTGKDVGGYDIVVTVADNETNYTGTVKMKWYVINDAKDSKASSAANENQSQFEWNDTKTTIANKGAVRAFINRPANTSYSDKIAEYGLIYERNGKLDAPTFGYNNQTGKYTVDEYTGEDHTPAYIAAKKNGGYYKYGTHTGGSIQSNNASAEVAKAYRTLQLGNGIVETVQYKGSTAQSKQELSTKINVKNVDTGVWVRPYVLLENGDIYYGEVRYINLVDEATDILQLKTAEEGARAKDVQQAAVTRATVYAKATKKEKENKSWRTKVKAGFDEASGKYSVYSSYTLKTNSEVNEDAIQRFGFVLDRSGKINEENWRDDLKADKKGLVQATAVKDNKVMDKDEVGAKISPATGVCDVWVRTFVDFGDGLIVYTNPVHLKSISKQFDANKPVLKAVKNGDKFGLGINCTSNNSDDDRFKTGDNIITAPVAFDSGATIKSCGVVADINGSFTKLETKEGTSTYKYAEKGMYDFITKTFIADSAKTKGWNAGLKPYDEDKDYYAQITPNYDGGGRQIPVTARPYVIYVINGNEITVYGDAVTITGFENKTTAVTLDPDAYIG